MCHPVKHFECGVPALSASESLKVKAVRDQRASLLYAP